jgi:probable HAF family extracellular repeat protein
MFSLHNLQQFLGFAIICTLAVSSSCAAQSESSRYRVVDLGISLVREPSLTPGLNNNGDAAIWRSSDDTSAYGAFFHFGKPVEILGTSDFPFVYPADVSRRMTVVGSLQAQQDIRFTRAFTWHNAQLALLPAMNGKFSAATAINNAEKIAGNADVGGAPHAVLWNAGQIEDLGLLASGDYSEAHDINNHDQVVGTANITAKGRPHGFLWEQGRMKALPEAQGASFCSAQAINDNHEIVGTSDFPPQLSSHATLWRGDRITDLGSLGDDEETTSAALDINIHTQIVGVSEITDGKLRGFLWEKGKMVDLNKLIPKQSGWLLLVASRINDNGEILGRGRYENGIHAFLLIPLSRK